MLNFGYIETPSKDAPIQTEENENISQKVIAKPCAEVVPFVGFESIQDEFGTVQNQSGSQHFPNYMPFYLYSRKLYCSLDFSQQKTGYAN